VPTWKVRGRAGTKKSAWRLNILDEAGRPVLYGSVSIS
jgi:hypothetical protein